MTDEQRHDQVGFASNGFFETPALDALAARGVRFDQAYSALQPVIRSERDLEPSFGLTPSGGPGGARR
jgi:hypothetical protein